MIVNIYLHFFTLPNQQKRQSKDEDGAGPKKRQSREQ